ncbi:MAG: F0F1 ATP synthase subunit A [Acidobacteria bacterium]|nr:F0F1 ATP synthase subunit A [Acidobacteriota bacterium]
MHETSAVGNILNTYLFDPIARAAGVHLEHGHHAVPDHIVIILLIAIALILFAWWLRGKLSVENPGKVQHLVEVIFIAIQNLMREVIGPEYRRFTPLICTLAIYILIGNILGMIPGFISPTSNLNITAACGLSVFVYYNYQGFRKQGFLGYLKHFCGPVLWIAPLLFVIEIISHMARPFSLSVRLFGNIFAEELIIGSLNELFPFIASIPVMFLGLFASTIQAFIFILLTMVYISGAVEQAHEEGHGEGHKESTVHQSADPVAAV